MARGSRAAASAAAKGGGRRGQGKEVLAKGSAGVGRVVGAAAAAAVAVAAAAAAFLHVGGSADRGGELPPVPPPHGPLFRWDLAPGEEVRVPVPADDGVPARTLTLRGLSARPGAIVIDDFMTPRETATFAQARQYAKPTMLLDVTGKEQTVDKQQTRWRNGLTATFPVNGATPERVARRLHHALRIPTELVRNSTLQVVVYNAADKEHYYPHYDSRQLRTTGQKKGPLEHLSGEGYPYSARFVTVLLYLTSGCDGGETFFPYAHLDDIPWALTGSTQSSHIGNDALWREYCARPRGERPGASVCPKKGRALVFYSHFLGSDGRPADMDPASFHGSCDLRSGEKMLVNMWLNVHPADYTADAAAWEADDDPQALEMQQSGAPLKSVLYPRAEEYFLRGRPGDRPDLNGTWDLLPREWVDAQSHAYATRLRAALRGG